MVNFPLVDRYAATAAVAQRGGRPLGLTQFLADIAALAAQLPAGPAVVNLCRDRYRFAVGLGAALTRRQTTLLPPMEAAGVIAQLAEDYPGSTLLCDGPAPVDGLPVLTYPDLPVATGNGAIPSFPAGQPAIVLFTSGSTGQPQPQPKNWGMLVRSAQAAAARIGAASLQGCSLLGTVPHQHSYGFESTIMLPLQTGMVLQAERPLLPANVLAALTAMPAPRLLITAPIHLRALLDEPSDLPTVELILSATAPLAGELAVAAEARFGARLFEIYGCSEAGQVATRRTALGTEWDCFDGLHLTQDGDATFAEGALVAGQRIRLNDIITLIDPAHFQLQGRANDMINVAGKRASLAHLNHALSQVAGVQDGVYLPPAGDVRPGDGRLSAAVIAPGLRKCDILKALKQQIDSAFLPRPLHLVQSLPRNALGKITQEALGQLAAELRRHG